MAIPVRFGDDRVEDLKLYEGDIIRDVASAFLNQNGIGTDQLDPLVRMVSEAVTKDKSLVVEPTQVPASKESAQEQPSQSDEVSIDVTITVPLVLKIGEPLEQAALRFCQQHGLDAEKFQKVLMDNIAERATTLTQIQRAERELQATLTVKIDDRAVPMQYFKGDDKAATVQQFCEANGLPTSAYHKTLLNALNELVANA